MIDLNDPTIIPVTMKDGAQIQCQTMTILIKFSPAAVKHMLENPETLVTIPLNFEMLQELMGPGLSN